MTHAYKHATVAQLMMDAVRQVRQTEARTSFPITRFQATRMMLHSVLRKACDLSKAARAS